MSRVSLVVSLTLAGTACMPRPCEPVGVSFVPSFEAVPCPPDQDVGDASCGVLHTSEMPGDPGSCPVDVTVLTLAPTSPDAGEVPSVLLPGGPGQVILHAASQLSPIFESWREAGPVWLLDPRGGGASRPSLRCDDPQARRAMRRAGPDFVDQLAACADAWRSRGVNLDAYRTDRLADDVAALVRARGEASVHVVGGSYGTRWAQTLLRRHPDVVRSVIFDAPAPWSVRLYEGGAEPFYDALTRVFEACDADDACAEALPDGMEAFVAVREALDAQPLDVVIGPHTLAVDGRRFAMVVFDALKSSRSAGVVPGVVLAARDGDVAALGGFMARQQPPGVVPMLHHAISCADAFPFADPAVALAHVDPTMPDLRPYEAQAPTCAVLGVTPSDDDARVVPPLDVPALVLSGMLDPMVPPPWAFELAKDWPDAKVWIDPSAAHGVLRSSCGGAIAGAFLRDPEGFTWPNCVGEARLQVQTDLAAWVEVEAR